VWWGASQGAYVLAFMQHVAPAFRGCTLAYTSLTQRVPPKSAAYHRFLISSLRPRGCGFRHLAGVRVLPPDGEPLVVRIPPPFLGRAGRSTGYQVPFAPVIGRFSSLWFVDSWQSYHLPRSAGDGSNWYPPLGVTGDGSPPLEEHMQRY
jgi:hypothetical protein